MIQGSSCSSTATLEKDVPVIRLKNDSDLSEIYKYEKKLGQGSFGAVYEATHIATQTKWAIKEVSKPAAGSSKVDMVDNEISILKQINHANIIRLEAVYSSSTMIYLVSELCTGGNLRHLLKKRKFLTEDETRKIIFCLADAVSYLHRRDIVHRDLKLENILLKNSPDEDGGNIDIKVADFGLSVRTVGVGIHNVMTDACGTLIYMAPEMLTGRGYSQWCDLWSIGVIMFMLLCGEPPFASKTKEELLQNIVDDRYKFTQSIWDNISDAAKHLLNSLLKVDPADRMSIHQLLETPWITGETNKPCGPTNVMEMMSYYLEYEEIFQTEKETLEVSSLTFSEDNLEPSLTSLVLSADPESSCGSHAKLHPERDSNSCESSTSIKLSHAGEKSSKQLSAKPCRPHAKKNPSAGRKPTSASKKADDQRPSSSRKVRPASANKQLAQRTIPV